MGDMKPVQYWGPTNIKCLHTKFSNHINQSPGFWTPL